MSGILAIGIVTVSSITAFAEEVQNGALMYEGGQTDKVVYSRINDHKTAANGNDDKLAWMVKATVKVGGTTYTSGFQKKSAYKDASRHWYTNESSYWDAYAIGSYD